MIYQSIYEIGTPFDRDWRGIDVSAERLSDEGKEGRFTHYKKVIESLVEGITDADEQSEFIDRFFSDSMIKVLQES